MAGVSSWSEQLSAAHDEVLKDIGSKLRTLGGGPSMLDDFKGFVAAVDWTEPWIVVLVALHTLLFLAVVTFRRRTWLQCSVFFGASALIYNAERLNALAARHWRSFARQPYFDPRGVFTSGMLSAPMLLVMFAVLINYLLAACQLLVEMKRKELRYKARQQHRAGQQQAPQGSGRRQRQQGGVAGSDASKKVE